MKGKDDIELEDGGLDEDTAEVRAVPAIVGERTYTDVAGHVAAFLPTREGGFFVAAGLSGSTCSVLGDPSLVSEFVAAASEIGKEQSVSGTLRERPERFLLESGLGGDAGDVFAGLLDRKCRL